MYLVRTSMLIAAVALAACEPTIPDSGPSGVGFGDLNGLQPIQPTGAAGQPLVAGGQISSESVVSLQAETATGQLQPVDSLEDLASSAIDAAEGGATTQTTPRAQPGGNAGISDEQDFAAVASRESIESDRERLAANREAYEVIQPGALPTRRIKDGATIVEFALATNHAVGVPVYKRSGLSGQARFDRNCAKYTSQDQAQSAFLAAGGPERDRYGIDPDGDGYACFWDPTPFRAAVGR